MAFRTPPSSVAAGAAAVLVVSLLYAVVASGSASGPSNSVDSDGSLSFVTTLPSVSLTWHYESVLSLNSPRSRPSQIADPSVAVRCFNGYSCPRCPHRSFAAKRNLVHLHLLLVLVALDLAPKMDQKCRLSSRLLRARPFGRVLHENPLSRCLLQGHPLTLLRQRIVLTLTYETCFWRTPVIDTYFLTEVTKLNLGGRLAFFYEGRVFWCLTIIAFIDFAYVFDLVYFVSVQGF